MCKNVKCYCGLKLQLLQNGCVWTPPTFPTLFCHSNPSLNAGQNRRRRDAVQPVCPFPSTSPLRPLSVCLCLTSPFGPLLLPLLTHPGRRPGIIGDRKEKSTAAECVGPRTKPSGLFFPPVYNPLILNLF